MNQGEQRTVNGLTHEFSDTTIEFDVETGTYRTTFDPTMQSPSDVVVESVSAVTGDAPLDLDPLYSAVDPDALDSLFAQAGVETARIGRTTFEYSDCKVTVSADGLVLVDPFTTDVAI